jgi:predicted RNase H-like nuclease (RuvC/YqgF family)
MHSYTKTSFLAALSDAANWRIFATEEELETVIYSDLEKICLERCLNKHKMFINNLENEISDLEDQVRDYEYDSDRYVRKLESEISELKKSVLPDKTLNDVEKIELLQKYWGQFTYDNLSTIIKKI